jgi:nucleoside-diphosphate-sugar epimerase
MFTVLGSNGFIGRHVTAQLSQSGAKVIGWTDRDLASLPAHLGHAIYCVGFTADFRTHPAETMASHVELPAAILARFAYDSFTYLSTTRFYRGLESSSETTKILVDSANPDHLLDLSKLSGEALVHRMAGDRGRIVRLANVFGDNYGSPTFLSSILRDGARNGRAVFQTAPASTKDYISVRDVANILPRLALEARQQVYNLSSGIAVSNQEIADTLEDLGVEVAFADNAVETMFPAIDNQRLREEFGFAPLALRDRLPKLLAAYRSEFGAAK